MQRRLRRHHPHNSCEQRLFTPAVCTVFHDRHLWRSIGLLVHPRVKRRGVCDSNLALPRKRLFFSAGIRLFHRYKSAHEITPSARPPNARTDGPARPPGIRLSPRRAPPAQGGGTTGPCYKHPVWEHGKNLSQRLPVTEAPGLKTALANPPALRGSGPGRHRPDRATDPPPRRG